MQFEMLYAEHVLTMRDEWSMYLLEVWNWVEMVESDGSVASTSEVNRLIMVMRSSLAIV